MSINNDYFEPRRDVMLVGPIRTLSVGVESEQYFEMRRNCPQLWVDSAADIHTAV